MGTLLPICVKVREAIESLFVVVSVVGHGLGVVFDGGPRLTRGSGGFGGFLFHWFEWRF